jgi:hypothetical protein
MIYMLRNRLRVGSLALDQAALSHAKDSCRWIIIFNIRLRESSFAIVILICSPIEALSPQLLLLVVMPRSAIIGMLVQFLRGTPESQKA